jgi:Tol biopolymer transport system component
VVSSAVYLPGSDGEKVVYYSYGSIPEGVEDGPTPGYYLLNIETGEDSLLLEHRSPAGLEEIVNGFDVSPDGRALLYPINYDNFRGSRPPKVVRYDLNTATPDTLSWHFRPQLLWLRYSPSGSRLLYGIYDESSLNTGSGRTDSIGVIDLATGSRRSLNTQTHPEEEESMDLFPRWAPSGQSVIYGSAPVDGERGAVGHFSLYVLRDVN